MTSFACQSVVTQIRAKPKVKGIIAGEVLNPSQLKKYLNTDW